MGKNLKNAVLTSKGNKMETIAIILIGVATVILFGMISGLVIIFFELIIEEQNNDEQRKCSCYHKDV